MKNARHTTIKAIIGSAVAAFALTGGAGTAVAGAPEAASKVSIDEKDFNFKGKVTSEKHICEARRLVKVYRIDNAENRILVGQDKTDNSGSYKFDVNVINGGDEHFAVAQLKEADNATCVKAKSEKFFP
jgi:hypothetical protein